MSKYVPDASVLLALLNREKGHQQAAVFLWEGVISSVNLSEVAAKLFDQGLPNATARQVLHHLDLEVVPFDEAMAFEAAKLRSVTRRQGLSLGDRACLATAAVVGGTAVTADRSWKRLKLGFDIQLIR